MMICSYEVNRTESRMKKPLLSICIPTYNRSVYLRKSIESIVCQREFTDGDVEIVISDNASEDDTQAVGKEFAGKYDNFHYYRNEENIRDRNYSKVISEANGALRRLSNDTLIYENGSLSYMCDLIRKNEHDRPLIFWANGSAKPHEEIEHVDFRGFIRNVSFWITSIACFSIWEEKCENIEKDIAGCDLLLWQVRKGLELAYDRKNVLICNRVLTKTQTVEKKNISYGLYKVFYENYFELLSPYFDNGALTKDDREYLEKDLLFDFFMNWCIQWKLNAKGLEYSKTENLDAAVENAYQDKPYWKQYIRERKKRMLKMKIKRLLGRG